MTHIAKLSHRTLIRITGPDWAPFLKGLCTAPFDDLIREEMIRNGGQNAPLKLAYGAFLRPQGKMYADCLLHATSADEIRLDVAVNAREELLARLNMYKLRAKIAIETLEAPVFAAFGGPAPAGFIPDARGDILGQPLAFAYTPQATNADIAEWTAFRYGHGLSDPGQDFDKDELYAIDANLDLLGAIDFHKGCYVGQELTSRMKRRGQIKNRILPLVHRERLDNGAEVLNGERKAGEVLASSDTASLALMRLDRVGDGLTANGQSVALRLPGWLANVIQT